MSSNQKRKSSDEKKNNVHTIKFYSEQEIDNIQVSRSTQSLFDNVFLKAYHDFLGKHKFYNEKKCNQYFEVLIQRSIENISAEIQRQNLEIRKEFAELTFRSLKFLVEDYKKLGVNFSSPQKLQSAAFPLSQRKHYSNFYIQQNEAFDTFYRRALQLQERIMFEIDAELFNQKVGKPLVSPSNKNSTMVWTKSPKSLKGFYDYLIKEEFIEEIPFEIFSKHFSGFTDSVYIRWKAQGYKIHIVLDSLYGFLTKDFYTVKKSYRPSEFAKHFKFKNEIINTGKLSKYKNQVPSRDIVVEIQQEIKTVLSLNS